MSRSFTPTNNGTLTGRRLELFHAPSLAEWGYNEEQTDSFAVLHPSEECKEKEYPLYVVFHSAGHDLYSALATLRVPGDHDIYHAPTDMFALYLDCRQHEDKDWWWGGNSALGILGEDRRGTKTQPVENRVMATIEWVMNSYPIDRNRVYAVGVSMGGSGAMGIAMPRGDVFAAVKVDVAAGVRHMADRCALSDDSPEGFKIPDPPVLVDFSAQNDSWSKGHRVLYDKMAEKKYALLGYWGEFGHCANYSQIGAVNDLIHSFDIFSVRLDEAYPVFTNADTDDTIPWNEDGTIAHENAGQVNSFFRWGKAEESESSVSIELRLITEDEWESRVTFPKASTADVTLRRLQKCRFAPGADVVWEFGDKNGIVTADEDGIVTVPGVTVTADPEVLKIYAR